MRVQIKLLVWNAQNHLTVWKQMIKSSKLK